MMWRGTAACWGVALAVLVSAVPLALASTGLPPAPLVDRGPIRIDGDAAFTAANGVTAGHGTGPDPYAIEGWNITAAGGDGVTILHTSAYYVVRNVTVHSGGQTYAGIRLTQSTNATFENDSLVDCAPAFAIDGSSNVAVVGSHFASNYASAWVTSSTGISFTGNDFQAGGGMEFTDSRWVNVTGNTASNPQFRVGTTTYTSSAHYNISENTIQGIQTNVFELNGIDGIVVEGNRISATGPGIVVQRSANVSVYRNIVSSGASGGIDVGESQHVLVEKNAVANVVPGRGINVALSSDVLVSENNLTNNEQGIGLQGNMNVTATGNTLTGSGFWIDADTLAEYRSVNVTNNTVNGLPFAAYRGCNDLALDRAAVAQVFLVDCRHVTIKNQTFDHLETGIKLINVEDAVVGSSAFRNSVSDAALRIVGGANITVQSSNFTRNRGYGIWVWSTANLTVVGSTMTENWIGMMIWNTTNATMYHNNFVRQQTIPEQAIDSATVGSRWDDGYPDGGNYWSHFAAPDDCSGPAQDVCGNPDGIADVPSVVWPGGVDRYPLIRPYGIPAIPPIARIEAPQLHLTATQVAAFDGGGSSDEDGVITAWTWDFGDGSTATGSYVTHAWSAAGLYNVTLTVRDNSYETNSASVQVSIEVPTPTAILAVRPSGPYYVTQSLIFDGSGSGSPWGGIASYAWDFGDGASGSGAVVNHTFSSEGTYSVRLTVTNVFGVRATTGQSLTVERIPDIPLRSYANRAGFRIPVPSDWSLQEDVPFHDVTFAAVVQGPVHEGFTTNIIIDTGHDTTVREDNAYLASVVDGVVQSSIQSSPGSFLSEGPIYRSIGGHAGVVFAITDPAPPPIIQKFAMIVSDEHDRYWILLISAHADYFFLYDAMFGRMVDGFEITLPAPVNGLLWGVIAVSAAALGAIAFLVIITRRRKAKPAPLGLNSRPYSPVPVARWADQYCTKCGAPATSTAHFCSACGAPLALPRPDVPSRVGEPPPPGPN